MLTVRCSVYARGRRCATSAKGIVSLMSIIYGWRRRSWAMECALLDARH